MKELTPHEAYDRYVGLITVDEFLKPFDGDIDIAVDQLMTEQWWVAEGGSHPDNLSELIKDYLIDQEHSAWLNHEEELSYRYEETE
jgi:hypothetical protein